MFLHRFSFIWGSCLLDAMIYMSWLDLTVFILYFLVCDRRRNNLEKISHCLVRTKQTYKHCCECCFNFDSVVDQGRCSGIEVCVLHCSPAGLLPDFPGLLQGIPRNCPIALKLYFCFPQLVFCVSLAKLIKIWVRHWTLSMAFQSNFFIFSWHWTSVPTHSEKSAMPA